MNDHDHIVLGALFHDIGKFWERAERLGEYRADEHQKQLDCPWNKNGNYWSHLHALHTRRFCEELIDRVPFLKPVEGQHGKTAEDHWLNLAVRHHVASSPLQLLIEAADHFASAEREQGLFYEKNIHKRTRLESILERVSLDGKSRQTRYRLPLATLSLEAGAITPELAEKFEPAMVLSTLENGDAWLSPESLVAEYSVLADGFLMALDRLPRYDRATPSALRSLVISLLAQMERFLSCVPAATNILHPDISLFDHLRVTPAIAEGLYLHHEATGTLDEPSRFHDPDVPKWRLVCGDFSGIQDFIYSITSKGAAKGLRGRSLYIQLLCDGVSDHLLRILGLYPTARIYSSGGKFYLLIPDCLEDKLRREVTNINKALLEAFQGKIFLGIGIAQVCGHDFGYSSNHHMGSKWKEANEALLQDRLQRFRPLAEADSSFFAAQNLHSGSACGLCGRDDKNAEIRYDEGGPICHQCRMLKGLGKTLTDANYLFWVWGEDRKIVREPLRNLREESFDLPGVDCELYLLREPPSLGELRRLEKSHLEIFNQLSDPDGNPNGYAFGFRLVGKWDRTKEPNENEWEFDDFAEHSININRFGVLRLDVDNLGEIFIRGLRFPGVTGEEKEMGSLSRVATLSRQLHLFFAGYLSELLSRYKRTQIIYAGGDDVFLIGSWDELPAVAWEIRHEFQRYCANNPVFTLSGGIALAAGKYPISRAAELAGAAESAAKRLERRNKKKDAISFLDTAIGWEEFSQADKLVREIQIVIDKSRNRGILSRLRNVVMAVEEYHRRSRQQKFTADELRELVHWQRWRWQLVYNLKRLEKRYPELSTELNNLVNTILDVRTTGGRPVLDWLELPTRWAEFLTRRVK